MPPLIISAQINESEMHVCVTNSFAEEIGLFAELGLFGACLVSKQGVHTKYAIESCLDQACELLKWDSSCTCRKVETWELSGKLASQACMFVCMFMCLFTDFNV